MSSYSKKSNTSVESTDSLPWQDGCYFQCSLIDLTAIGSEGSCSDADCSDVSGEFDQELSPLDTAFLCEDDDGDSSSLPKEDQLIVCIRHQNVCICQQTDERQWSQFSRSDNSVSVSKNVADASDEKVNMRSVKKVRMTKGLGSKLVRWFSQRKVTSNRKSSVLVCDMADSDQLRWSCLF